MVTREQGHVSGVRALLGHLVCNALFICFLCGCQTGSVEAIFNNSSPRAYLVMSPTFVLRNLTSLEILE